MRKNTKIKHLIKIIAFVAIFSFYVLPAQASEINAEDVLKYVNASREEEGLPNLTIDPALSQVAMDKLNDMIGNHYFAHTSPEGITPWHWFEKNKYDYKYAGENLAINFLTAEAQHKAWMKSPTHRKNIMNPEYQEIGIAVGAGEIDGQVSIISVQSFGTKAGAAAKDPSKNFSSGKNTDLIKEEGQIIPQVLSVKKSASLQNQKTNGVFSPKNIKALDIADTLAFALLLFALVLSPATFLSIAYEKMILIGKNGNNKSGLISAA